MSLKQKALKAYDWLVNKVKGNEIPAVILGSIIGVYGTVVSSYLLRDVELTVLKYFELLLSPLGLSAVIIGGIGYVLGQIATSTEKICILSPIGATISTAITAFAGILILGESINIFKITGIALCILGVWAIYKNHDKK